MLTDTNLWRRVNYAILAPLYDRLSGMFTRARRRSIELADLHAPQRLLIVGAGTGLDLPLLPAGLSVTATDISQPMLRRLEARAAAENLDVQALVADAMDLPFADAAFDAVMLHLLVSVAPDAGRCMAEAYRVLKPGGKALILDKFLPQGRFKAAMARIFNPLASFFGTTLTCRREAVTASADWRVLVEEPAPGRGPWRILLLEK
jgi:phosphatidylethanolamine/phosphatidyl-N-methylethanolamine N-methyltransferase